MFCGREMPIPSLAHVIALYLLAMASVTAGEVASPKSPGRHDHGALETLAVDRSARSTDPQGPLRPSPGTDVAGPRRGGRWIAARPVLAGVSGDKIQFAAAPHGDTVQQKLDDVASSDAPQTGDSVPQVPMGPNMDEFKPTEQKAVDVVHPGVGEKAVDVERHISADAESAGIADQALLHSSFGQNVLAGALGDDGAVVAPDSGLTKTAPEGGEGDGVASTAQEEGNSVRQVHLTSIGAPTHGDIAQRVIPDTASFPLAHVALRNGSLAQRADTRALLNPRSSGGASLGRNWMTCADYMLDAQKALICRDICLECNNVRVAYLNLKSKLDGGGNCWVKDLHYRETPTHYGATAHLKGEVLVEKAIEHSCNITTFANVNCMTQYMTLESSCWN